MCATLHLRKFQDRIARQRLRHPRPFVGAIENVFGARHAKRIEDVLLFELVQGLPRYDLDDAADDVRRMTVTPKRARLPRQRQFGDALGKYFVVILSIEQAGIHVSLVDQLAADIVVGDA